MSQPPKQLKDRDWLYNQYVTLNKSASQIGRELECQQETVSRWLHKYQIELRPHGQDVSGEKSGLYHKPVSEERRKHIREGVIASYKSGKNSRWTEEKRADWSKQMSGSGNYNYGRVTPDEQKERQMATLKKTLEMHPEIRKQMSESHKEYSRTHPEALVARSIHMKKFSEDHPERAIQLGEKIHQYYIDHPLTEEERAIRASYILNYHKEHPEARKIHSNWMKIPGHAPATRPEVALKLSNAMKEWHYNNKSPNGCGQCCGRHFCTNDGSPIWLRSSYETRYAGILNLLGILWEYENTAFKLPSNNTSYRPDFYLPEYDTYIEVKGYLSPTNRRKMTEFHEVYPEERLFIVYLEDLENIEHEILCQTPFNILDFGNPLADQIEEWKNFI